MLSVVLGSIIVSFANRQLDMIEKFHIGALIDIVQVAGSMIGKEESGWPAVLNTQRLAIEPIDKNRFLSHRGERNTGMKIVSRSVQADVGGG